MTLPSRPFLRHLSLQPLHRTLFQMRPTLLLPATCSTTFLTKTFHAQSSSEPRVGQSNEEEPILGTSCKQLDFENSDREVLSLSKPEHQSALEVDAGSKIQSETFHAQSSSKPRVDQFDEDEPMLGISCTQLDSEHSDSFLSFSKPEHHSALYFDAGSNILSESFHAYLSSEATLGQFDEEPMLDTSCSQLESEKSDSYREISTSLSKVEDHNALEVEAGSKIQSELFHAHSLSKPTLDQSDEEPELSTSCTVRF